MPLYGRPEGPPENSDALKCAHDSCQKSFFEAETIRPLGRQLANHRFPAIRFSQCPACLDYMVDFVTYSAWNNGPAGQLVRELRIYPRTRLRPACPMEVPDAMREDYDEAVLVLEDSPKASAALSRRCLQTLLREVARVKNGDLVDEIAEVTARGALPSTLAGNLDAVRMIGNFAAHPQKSKTSGEILPVEPHEALWNLEVLEGLFEILCVAPARNQARKDELNKKLREAGKKELP